MTTRFGFAFGTGYAPVLLLWGVTPERAYVEVDAVRFDARFGFFRVRSALADISAAEVHPGPFNPLRAIGVRYSFSDGSATFGSDTGPMVELRFDRPVTVRPPGLTRHPALWVSVADPDGLVAAVSGGGRTDAGAAERNS